MDGLSDAIKLRERLITLLNRNPGSLNSKLTDEQVRIEIAQLEDEIDELRQRKILLSEMLDMMRREKEENVSLFERTHVLEDGWTADLLSVVDGRRMKEMEMEGAECPICVERMGMGMEAGRVRVLPCGHAFHRECIWTWLLVRDSCPYCRMGYRIYRGPGGRGLGWVGLFGVDDRSVEDEGEQGEDE